MTEYLQIWQEKFRLHPADAATGHRGRLSLVQPGSGLSGGPVRTGLTPGRRHAAPVPDYGPSWCVGVSWTTIAPWSCAVCPGCASGLEVVFTSQQIATWF